MISTAISGQSWWMGRLRITCFPLACAISVISNVWMWVNCNTVYVKWPSSTEDPWTSNLSCSPHLVQCSLSAGTVPGILQWNVSCRHWLIHYCKYRTISEQCFLLWQLSWNWVHQTSGRLCRGDERLKSRESNLLPTVQVIASVAKFKQLFYIARGWQAMVNINCNIYYFIQKRKNHKVVASSANSDTRLNTIVAPCQSSNSIE